MIWNTKRICINYKMFECTHNKAIETIRLELCYIIFSYFILGNTYFIVVGGNFLRCNHKPAAQEQATYLWLDNDANFTTFQETIPRNQPTTHLDNQTGKTLETNEPRHRRDTHSNLISPLEPDDLIWSLFRRPQPSRAQMVMSKDELVPMKIHIHYDSSVYSLEEQKFRLINNTVMPTVIRFFESVLSIRREHKIDTFRFAPRCPNNTIYYAKDALVGQAKPFCMDYCEDHAICGEVEVPREHLSACSFCNSTSRRCRTNYLSEGRGVPEAQLVLYVSAKQTARCKKDQTIAYAAHCLQDSRTHRPVGGHMNLCPYSISDNPKDLIATVKHEMTHVLGFSVSLFAYYIDPLTGEPLTDRESFQVVDPSVGYAKWSDKIIKKVVRRDWLTGEGKRDKQIHMIVTPTVVSEVRRHFNCSTLEGAELEDQGFDGTSLTHWEKRLFGPEALSGTFTQNSIYSRLTLALLQDTGWYLANFSRAENLEWGKNLGCEFAQKSCKSWIDERKSKGKSIAPFCDLQKGHNGDLQISCSDDLRAKAVCNIKKYPTALPLTYQNFHHLEGVERTDLAFYGGSVDLADYCPFIQEFTWQTQNVTVRGSSCEIAGNNQGSAALEFQGSKSKCFEHGRRWEQRSCTYKRQWHHFGAGCYEFTCTDYHFNILVGNQSYPCYYTNQVITIELIVDQWLHNGTIICPACERICPQHKCKSYDKRLIDGMINSMNAISVADRKMMIDGEDKVNSIQIDDPLNANFIQGTNRSKYKSRAKNLASLDEQEKFKIADLIARHRYPARHSLVCSGGFIPKFNFYHQIIITITLWVLYASCLLNSNNSLRNNNHSTSRCCLGS